MSNKGRILRLAAFNRGKLAASLLLLFSCLVTVWIWRLTQQDTERIASERFEFRVSESLSAIDERMLVYEQVLRGALGLFAASDDVTREEWRTYIGMLDVQQNYPGILGIGFAKRILPDELDDHIKRVQTQGFPAYAVWPKGQRAEYAPVVYIEPFDGRTLPAIGYDVLSEPVRRIAAEHARDMGLPTVSSKVTLVTETDDRNAPAGFLMFLPVYDQEPPPATVEQRRASLKGYVYGSFRMNDLMDGILGNKKPGFVLKIFDGSQISAQARMYESPSAQTAFEQDRPFSRTETIEVNGRLWTLQFTAPLQFEAGLERLTPLIIFILLSCISLLLFAVVWSLATVQERAFMLAQRMTAAIKDSETRLREITSALGEGVYVQDKQGLITFVNPEAEKLLGWSEEELLGQDAHSFVHNHSSRFVASNSTGESCAMAVSIQSGVRFQAEDTFWRKDGKRLFVSVVASPLVRDGETSGSVVAFRDISEHKQTELALRDSYRFRSLFEYAQEALFLLESSGRIVDANRLACESLGYSRETLIGTFPDRFTRDSMVNGQSLQFLQILERVQDYESVLMEAEYVRRDGSHFPGEAVFSAIEYEGRDLILSAVRDITERKQAERELKQAMMDLERAKQEAESANRRLAKANQQLQRISQIDGLTGVANRRYFDQYLAKEWKRAARNGHKVSMILADVDHFKAFNDHYGHQAGDDCLTKVAKALQQVVHRPADLLARYGGEEFVAVLPDTGVGGAFHIAEAMRKAVADLRIPHAKSSAAPHVTLSLGVAVTAPREEPGAERLIAAADKALYEAKAEGRDAVRMGQVTVSPE